MLFNSSNVSQVILNISVFCEWELESTVQLGGLGVVRLEHKVLRAFVFTAAESSISHLSAVTSPLN